MKKALLCLGIISLFFSSCTEDRTIEAEKVIIIDPSSQLIYYWNFNTLSGTVTTVNPDFTSSPAQATITYDGVGAGFMDGDTGGYTINARNNDPAENLLKVRNPSNTRNLILTLPTTGFKKMVFQFALSRSNNGATTQNYTYTTDGINYTNVGLSKISHNPSADPTVDLIALDFSSITSINNNPNFKLKIDFVGEAAGNPTGNNRFDNITLEGIPIL
jgi:hypothetical protein